MTSSWKYTNAFGEGEALRWDADGAAGTRGRTLTWRRAAGALTAAKEKRAVWADIVVGGFR